MACTAKAVGEADTGLFGGADERAPESLGEHPYGDTALERMVVLAHTEALPKCDKLVIATIRLPPSVTKAETSSTTDHGKSERENHDKKGKRVLAERTLDASQTETVCDQWRQLTFDKWLSAFCHYPAYRLRFYRQKKLLFETTVCWHCNNFVLPDVSEPDSEEMIESDRQSQFYGFESNETSKRLLTTLRELLPHPGITEEQPQRATD